MTDRDAFAAAALTGLLYPEVDDEFAMPYIVGRAYLWADAMLRERERTNHDAAPAARAQVDAAGISRQGTGNPVEPVAWAVVSNSKEEIDCEFVYPDSATAGDVALDSNGGVVPLYRHPQPTLTDAEREAVRYMIAAGKFGQRDEALTEEHAATLRGLLERLGGGE